MPETHAITFEGHQILAVLDHASAVDILEVAGHSPPVIPRGCNTVLMLFKTAEGRRALAVNQTAFAPEAKDDEREVNGCLVLILQDTTVNDEAAEAILEAFFQTTNKP